ncbi:MAG: UDP-N-acetylmuramoyl-L-alanyl-D-glutamate--2,6-diaminopimelate ligase [Candidatus Gracilibacteria bacterium]|jgi:UDP-N-acetylmuramoyl-L-alanyl-D-glutamate--2,6-diaminopimelate ligase
MKKFLNKIFPDTNPIRLLYHRALAIVAAFVYRFPANKMIIIGVTGTKGKTTTVNLIANILKVAGFKLGMASTVNFQIGHEKWINDTKQTTLKPFRLQKLLKKMLNAGCKYAVLEVSSHAITQSRTWGINFDVAVVTNIANDHLEYHGGFNSYLAAKGKLFNKVSTGKRKFGVPKILVMNSDDQYYSFFNQFVADRKISYGLKGGTIYADQIEKNPEGSHFVLKVPNNQIAVKLKLPGEFNIYNSLAAASVAIALQIPLETIKQGLEESSSVAGRCEHVRVGQKFDVIVDYAHTTESLNALLSLYRKLTKGRMFAVFGATGDRDKAKRPLMGAVANELADYIILTNEDPFSEHPWDIIEGIAVGVKRTEGNNFWKILDRREAIRLALTLAREGDTVVCSGKGAEEVIVQGDKKIPWNEKKIIEDLLTREVEVEIGPDTWEKRENVCFKS